MPTRPRCAPSPPGAYGPDDEAFGNLRLHASGKHRGHRGRRDRRDPGHLRRAVRGGARGVPEELRRRARRRRLGRRLPRGRAGGRPVGRLRRRGRTVPWERDTITNVWSTTKTMTNLCALILADQGEHRPPRARRHLLARVQGQRQGADRGPPPALPHGRPGSGWEEPITVEDLYDWEKATGLLAAQKPWWEPGTASGYHALTQGYLVGEVVRRVTGQSLGHLLREGGRRTARRPTSSSGSRRSDDARTVRVIPPENAILEQATPEMLENPLLHQDLHQPGALPRRGLGGRVAAGRDPGRQRAEQRPGRGGGAVDRLQPRRGPGGPAHVAQGVRRHLRGAVQRDRPRHRACRSASGSATASATRPSRSGPDGCFWGGLGGSIVVSDLDARITIAYVMNRMEAGLIGDVRGISLVMAAVLSLASG